MWILLDRFHYFHHPTSGMSSSEVALKGTYPNWICSFPTFPVNCQAFCHDKSSWKKHHVGNVFFKLFSKQILCKIQVKALLDVFFLSGLLLVQPLLLQTGWLASIGFVNAWMMIFCMAFMVCTCPKIWHFMCPKNAPIPVFWWNPIWFSSLGWFFSWFHS